MNILNRYLSHEIINGTALVFFALLMLFGFFDLIHELGDLGKGSYRLTQVFVFVLLKLPGHVYELFPIAALIGTLLALAQLAAQSELTVMRVSGLSVPRIALAMMQTGMLFVVITFLFGEFIAPHAERAAQQMRIRAMSAVVAQEFRSGLWLRDDMSFVNVREVLPDTTLMGVKIYEFDATHRLRVISFAKEARYLKDNNWNLIDIEQTRFQLDRTSVDHLPQAYWRSVLNPDMLSVLLVAPEQMSAWNLYFYVQHLQENHQKTTRHLIALWSKLFYPLAVLVMMLLALPFAFHQARAGGISAKIFAGIALGLVFHLSNRVFAHLGLLNEWPALFSAAFPTAMFLVSAVGLLWKMERR